MHASTYPHNSSFYFTSVRGVGETEAAALSESDEEVAV